MQKHKTQYPKSLATRHTVEHQLYNPPAQPPPQPWAWGCLGAEAHCHRAASWEKVKCTASPGKGPNSKFKAQFLLNVYHFLTTVKSKYHESNHCKPGTISLLTLNHQDVYYLLQIKTHTKKGRWRERGEKNRENRLEHCRIQYKYKN